MALSNKKILEEKKKGNIIISPFNPSHLSTSSYDLTLGEFYFREQKPNQKNNHIYNIFNKEHTERVWGKKWHQAKKASEVLKDFNFEYGKGINKNDKVILISPGETILAHTNEFIGGQNHITTMMKARSSMGRVFIEVCKCAGWGDVGYINRWTMEITNNSSNYTVPLVVGRRLAQMIFFETGEILDTDYTKSGKYCTSKDLRILKKNWEPTNMLPQLYKDRDIKK